VYPRISPLRSGRGIGQPRHASGQARTATEMDRKMGEKTDIPLTPYNDKC